VSLIKSNESFRFWVHLGETSGEKDTSWQKEEISPLQSIQRKT